MDIFFFHPQFIHVRIGCSRSSKQFLFTAMYVSSHADLRRVLWQALNELSKLVERPWILVGDFNCIIDSSERSRGVTLS